MDIKTGRNIWRRWNAKRAVWLVYALSWTPCSMRLTITQGFIFSQYLPFYDWWMLHLLQADAVAVECVTTFLRPNLEADTVLTSFQHAPASTVAVWNRNQAARYGQSTTTSLPSPENQRRRVSTHTTTCTPAAQSTLPHESELHPSSSRLTCHSQNAAFQPFFRSHHLLTSVAAMVTRPLVKTPNENPHKRRWISRLRSCV